MTAAADVPWPDLDRLDRLSADLLGLAPREVDRLSFRDLWVMLGGARDREQRAWQHTLATATAVFNWGGMRGPSFQPKPLDFLFKQTVGRTRREMPAHQIAALLSSVAVPEGHGNERA